MRGITISSVTYLSFIPFVNKSSTYQAKSQIKPVKYFYPDIPSLSSLSILPLPIYSTFFWVMIWFLTNKWYRFHRVGYKMVKVKILILFLFLFLMWYHSGLFCELFSSALFYTVCKFVMTLNFCQNFSIQIVVTMIKYYWIPYCPQHPDNTTTSYPYLD